jgi:hypothetical protein
MDKDLQELDKMMDELKGLNQELDHMHRQMTEQLLNRITLLEKLVSVLAKNPKKEVTIEKIMYKFRVTKDGEVVFDEEYS